MKVARSPVSAGPLRFTRSAANALPWPRSAPDGTPIGLDLAARRVEGGVRSPVPCALEVRRIVASVARGQALPFDVDDLQQEVALAILRRNYFASAFDPRKSAFSKYVWMLTTNVIGHMLKARAYVVEGEDCDELPDVAAEEIEPEDEGPVWRPKGKVVWERVEAETAPEPMPVVEPVPVPVPPKRWVQLSLFAA